jgi:hypothetical protein
MVNASRGWRMRITRIIAATSLMGILLILGACTPASKTPVTPVVIPAPVPPSPVFITSNLTIQPDKINPGYYATNISVTVTNTGEQPGTYTVVLNVDGSPVQSQDVSLAGGASQEVTFIFVPNKLGQSKITIDQLRGNLDVTPGV